ncbi:MAG: metal-dependent transcriptional regulator [Chloroflexota bacterium]|nr:metal-dependent transcriptional regulator [Chloroflexota bacterium]
MSAKALTESSQMYLLDIVRLRDGDEPVPLSRLAEELSVSPVSVNEMCRKLQEQGLVIYRPYKGASLTPEGEREAYRVLRKHRLWEVFLVEKLGYAYDKAHDAACQLEHGTSDLLAERLDEYLGYPSTNPLGQPIPRPDDVAPMRKTLPLAKMSVGQKGHVIRYAEASSIPRGFLREQGIHLGSPLKVLITAKDSMLIETPKGQVSLARDLANAISIEPDEADE